MTTTAELLLASSTLSSGTALQHIQNLGSGTGGETIYVYPSVEVDDANQSISLDDLSLELNLIEEETLSVSDTSDILEIDDEQNSSTIYGG